MIRKGTFQDIPTIMELTKACGRHMADQGIFQWNEHYPNPEAFHNDVKRNELYVLEVGHELIGCIVISEWMDEAYQSVQWLTANSNNLYVHRLAVNPDAQGQGLAQQLMDYAERFAIENNNSSIRLDTFSKNKRNQKFYELRGYHRLESIYFPKQSDHPFYCYELVL